MQFHATAFQVEVPAPIRVFASEDSHLYGTLDGLSVTTAETLIAAWVSNAVHPKVKLACAAPIIDHEPADQSRILGAC
jgi:hypothetical protein